MEAELELDKDNAFFKRMYSPRATKKKPVKASIFTIETHTC